MKKFFLSLVGSLFIIQVYAQNPVYNGIQKRERVFPQENGKSYIKLYENELLSPSASEIPAKAEDFTILGEGVRFEDFSPAELQLITANRRKDYYVRTSIGRKIVLISPEN